MLRCTTCHISNLYKSASAKILSIPFFVTPVLLIFIRLALSLLTTGGNPIEKFSLKKDEISLKTLDGALPQFRLLQYGGLI